MSSPLPQDQTGNDEEYTAPMAAPDQPAAPPPPGSRGRYGEEGADNPTGPLIRDRRRIDPLTGAVRPGTSGSVSSAAPGGSAGSAAAGSAAAGAGEPTSGADLTAALEQLAERTADLQRLQAEFANYRRRVERDREAVRDLALASVVSNLLPVLDDIGRARDHGELEGGFKAVAESLEAVAGKLGLQRFGEPGEAFDPGVHEALTHDYSPDVTEPTAVAVLQPGYRLGTRILRPALVAVAEPDPEGQPVPGPGEGDSTG